MVNKKRRTTSPLTDEDIAEALTDVLSDEILDRFDEIFSNEGGRPGTLQELVTLDDYMERELREMFQSIVAQYIAPVELAVQRVLGGEVSKETAEEGIDAIEPIVSASESLKYADITSLLREIERPLVEFRDGRRRRLNKKEAAAITEAWERLVDLLRVSTEPEAPRESAALSLSALARHVDGITSDNLRSFRRAGLSSLRELATAPAADIAQVSGIDESAAERVRAFAAGALSAGNRRRHREPAPVPPGWMRVRVESDVIKARLTFDYSVLGRHLEPILARLAEAEQKPAPKTKKAGATRARQTTKRSK